MSLGNNDLIDNTNKFPISLSNKYSFFSVGEVKSDYYSEKSDGIIFDFDIVLDII